MTVDIASLVRAAGGEIVGKIRLQKMVYLLDQMGLNSGYPFEYHHYGPYSESLAQQVEDDVFFDHIDSISRRRQRDGVPYVVYRAKTSGNGDTIDHNPHFIAALGEMQRHSSTVLELAATIHWLAVVEDRDDWQTELVRRKGSKTFGERDGEALDLLRRLNLPPAV